MTKMNHTLKIITILLFCTMPTQTIFASAEKGNPSKKQETQNIDIDLRISQRFTEEKKVATEAKTEKNDPKLVQPAAQPAPTEQADSTTASQSAVDPEPAPEPQQAPQLTPNILSFLGSSVPYQNGGMGSGQAIIDANPNGTASTWGGATPFSGTDGLNTHFIGHHWGAFDGVLSLANGSVITVFDSNGTPFNYSVYNVATVDQAGNDVNTGYSLYGEITSVGGGERIVLQTCIDETTRRIIFAA